jgi:hypothetical protein
MSEMAAIFIRLQPLYNCASVARWREEQGPHGRALPAVRDRFGGVNLRKPGANG